MTRISLCFRKVMMKWNIDRKNEGREAKKYRSEEECDKAKFLPEDQAIEQWKRDKSSKRSIGCLGTFINY